MYGAGGRTALVLAKLVEVFAAAATVVPPLLPAALPEPFPSELAEAPLDGAAVAVALLCGCCTPLSGMLFSVVVVSVLLVAAAGADEPAG